MFSRAAALAALASVLLLSRLYPAGADSSSETSPAAPARRRSFLLLKNGYQLKPDGGVWAPNSAEPVNPADLAALLQRLESAQRMKALIRLDLILSGVEDENRLAAGDKERLRGVLRENWPVLTLPTRKSFQKYFTPEELAGLNRDPAPVEAIPLPAISEQEPPDNQPPASPRLPASPPPATAAQLPIYAQTVQPSSAAAVAPPRELPFGTVESSTQPAAAAATPSTAAAPSAAAVPVPPVETPPASPREITQAEFEKFLVDAPYSGEAKALLRLVSRKAPEFARARALDAVVSARPMVALDSQRAGTGLHAALSTELSPSGEKNYVVALSPGPAIWTKKGFLLGGATILLPDSPRFYAERHLSLPALAAFKRDGLALKEEAGPWGATKLYEDGSRRGAYSREQLAGSLLHELLLLDADQEGWGASPYAAELYARTAELMLFSRLKDDSGKDDFLDPESRADLRQWLSDPGGYRDHLVHALSAARLARLDPSKGGPGEQAKLEEAASCAAQPPEAASARGLSMKAEAAALEEAGLIDSAQRDSAAKAIDADQAAARPVEAHAAADCPKRLRGLRLAARLLGEMNRAEQKFREERQSHAAQE